MSTIMARPSNTEHRRQEIVLGLMSAMAEKGYEKASIQSIAKAADLSPGLIHYHFKTKLEILIALMTELSDKADERYELLAANAESAEDKLLAYIDAALALGKGSNQQAVAAWVIIGAEAVRLEDVRSLYQEVIANHSKTLVELLIHASSDVGTTLNKKKAKELATFIIASIQGAYQIATTAPDESKNYAARILKEAVLNTLS
jgi:TetR/AcrR family transcriptional regulator, transcriptional repressor of bet genes